VAANGWDLPAGSLEAQHMADSHPFETHTRYHTNARLVFSWGGESCGRRTGRRGKIVPQLSVLPIRVEAPSLPTVPAAGAPPAAAPLSRWEEVQAWDVRVRTLGPTPSRNSEACSTAGCAGTPRLPSTCGQVGFVP
jgi:hypothetical protein